MRFLRLLFLVGLLGGRVVAADGDIVRVLFGGDTAMGGGYEESVPAGMPPIPREPEVVLRHLRPLLERQDAMVLNLETTFAAVVESPWQGRKNYLHRDDPSRWLPALAKLHLAAVSLANNHALDYGPVGLDQTLAALARHRIAAVGAGPDQAQADAPWIRQWRVGEATFTLAVVAAYMRRANYAERFAWYADRQHGGVADFDRERFAASIDAVRRQHPEAWIVAFLHGGRNYQPPTAEQMAMHTAALAAGADLVLGHGPHLVQPLAWHDRRWIVPSLGNGIFLTPGSYGSVALAPFSAFAELRVTAADEGVELHLRLYPFLSDNRATRWEPRWLSETEFERCRRDLLGADALPRAAAAAIATGRDEVGHYLELPLGRR